MKKHILLFAATNEDALTRKIAEHFKGGVVEFLIDDTDLFRRIDGDWYKLKDYSVLYRHGAYELYIKSAAE